MNNAYIRAQQCKVKEAKFPFVKIGSQYWTTKNFSLAVTPQGNTIPEVQANYNVEKITNIGFDTNIAGVISIGSQVGSWDSSGALKITSMGIYNAGTNDVKIITFPNTFNIGSYVKISFKAKSISGNTSLKTQLDFGINPSFELTTSYTVFNFKIHKLMNSSIIASALRFGLNGIGECLIDDVSVQEIGWSGSQELYDGIYEQTSGTVEQKTYAAVKASAMWSNYNNDAPTGLIYGKILNGFARRLINMDIAYYNAVNPTKPYVWGLPTKAQIQLLDTNGGNYLKSIGTTYLNDANGTNVTGFNAYGSGKRNTDGTFSGLKSNALFWVIGTNEVLQLESANNNATVISASEVEGYAIRLIKS